MIRQDTVKLLRECDAGIKMGVASIDDVLPHVSSPDMKTCLTRCKNEHEALDRELKALLAECHDSGKPPSPMARTMSRAKTAAMLAVKDSDRTVARLMTDGCDMGVKSLNKYLNRYRSAGQRARDITGRLIHLEEQLAVQLRPWL